MSCVGIKSGVTMIVNISWFYLCILSFQLKRMHFTCVAHTHLIELICTGRFVLFHNYLLITKYSWFLILISVVQRKLLFDAKEPGRMPGETKRILNGHLVPDILSGVHVKVFTWPVHDFHVLIFGKTHSGPYLVWRIILNQHKIIVKGVPSQDTKFCLNTRR